MSSREASVRSDSLERAIDTANELYGLRDCHIAAKRFKKVIVVLCSSRGGSSLFKSVLANHPDITSLDGEEEPYYALTRNGFPWTSDHDGFTDVVDRERLLSFMMDELMEQDMGERWRKRLLLQFPFESETIVGGYYDGAPSPEKFTRDYKIEEPPFVGVSNPKPLTDTLLLKTPQDAYRIGLFEKLFPAAEIVYVHLTRGFAQSVNGLMAGWECDWGFFAHNIKDRWWKFDLPPGWRDYVDSPLAERCLFQWLSAHRAVLDSDVPLLQLKFEDFLWDPTAAVTGVLSHVGLPPMEVGELPLVMTTEKPAPYRWHKRKEDILPLARNKAVRELMDIFGYCLDPETWC